MNVRTLAWVGGWVLAGAAFAGAESRPASDFSSPEKTWSAVCAALKSEDLPAFRAGFHNPTELSRLFMDAFSDMTITTFQLAHATARLGSEGKKLGLDSVYTDLVEMGARRRTDISGDTARWVRVEANVRGERREQVMYFHKVKGQWLIDSEQSYGLAGAEGRKAAEDFIASSKRQLPALKAIVADLEAGKITSVAELRKRMAAAQ